MKSAYQAGLSQVRLKKKPRGFSYRDGAIVGADNSSGPSLIKEVTVKVPDWTGWAGGGIVGLIAGLIIANKR